MLHPLVVSTVRTFVPSAVGALVSWLLVTYGITVPEQLVTEAVATLTLILTTGYYLACRAAERRWPGLSWLLGSTARPEAYADATGELHTDERVARQSLARTVRPRGRRRA